MRFGASGCAEGVGGSWEPKNMLKTPSGPNFQGGGGVVKVVFHCVGVLLGGWRKADPWHVPM